ncbi:hypothetical protein D9V41_10980 [Aeromicrobium phragmitis]|uniref:DUF559 domain-containing protein n=1 Tax=Aeromicrobium phragmitis TaxID=2478914 RepID=A0A3L8PLC8_9ACTN|nr:hypothetical protein [Aeromicrobium phragmitis]RLV55599.1 hypothetical protein D9V41_10980 [Aeromicrobium phragmitis]
MAAAIDVPDYFLNHPFTRAELVDAGISPRVLESSRFRRIHPRVWAHRDFVPSRADTVYAARLAMPPEARLSHESRLEVLGYPWPHVSRRVHFTIAGDLHLDLDGIFLHRTEVLPPCDDEGVTPAAAIVQMCAARSLLDVVKAGDWLLRHQHATREEIGEVARLHPWRPGAKGVRAVLPLLDGNAWALGESEVRVRLEAAGLPRPATNVPLYHGSVHLGTADLWLAQWRLAIEVEGQQHFVDPRQVESDVHRYAGYRRAGINYLQITKALRRQPRAMVTTVHRELVRLGYGGPPPRFGGRWHALLLPPGSKWR